MRMFNKFNCDESIPLLFCYFIMFIIHILLYNDNILIIVLITHSILMIGSGYCLDVCYITKFTKKVYMKCLKIK